MAQPSSEGEFVTRDGPANLGQSLELPYVNKERKPSPARSRPPPLRQSSTSSEPRSNRDRPRAQDSFTPDTATYRTPNEQSHYNDRPPPSTSSSSRRLGGHVDIELCMDKHINPHRQAIVLWQPYMQVKRGTIWKLLITPDRLQHTAPVLYCRAYSQCEVLDIDGCVQFQ